WIRKGEASVPPESAQPSANSHVYPRGMKECSITIRKLMSITVRSFAKINLGLRIGAARDDGFHELRTVYQTIALHDVLKIEVQRGTGIEIRCKDARVPTDESNTCYRMTDRVMLALKQRGKALIQIDKKLPLQGGLGAAS